MPRRVTASLCCQHATVTESIVARAQSVGVDEIGNPPGREARLAATASCRAAGMKALSVKQIRDLSIDVMIEQAIDALDEPGRRLHLLGGGLGIEGRERLRLPSFEADVDRRRAFGRELEGRGLLNEGGEQAVAIAIRRAGIIPERAEIRCQSGEPLAERVVEAELVSL